jgi:hypothetical protein
MNSSMTASVRLLTLRATPASLSPVAATRTNPSGRCGRPIFYAFDCLALDGRDLRTQPLIKRKRILEKLVKDRPGVLYAQHFDGKEGAALFRLVCEQDLEGVVAKRKDAAYGDGWYKIRNPDYSQYEGRRELFEKRRGGLTAAAPS